jgi:hypothetical protein
MVVLVAAVWDYTVKDPSVLAVQAQAHSLMRRILCQQAGEVVAEANQALQDLLVVLVAQEANMAGEVVLGLVEVTADPAHYVLFGVAVELILVLTLQTQLML